MSPQYYERPPGERLAALEADMAHVKDSSIRIEAMVHAVHAKVMRGEGVAMSLRQGGTWVIMVLASLFGSGFTVVARKVFGI